MSISPSPATINAPPADCQICPRLALFREECQAKYPRYHNAPVPSFGPVDAPLLIVGLAPGMHGANQTGRPFTGDYAGDLLYATLDKFCFSTGQYDQRPDDGLVLTGCRITNAVRCLPPQNKPETKEIANCRPYLKGEFDGMPQLRIILALGLIAHKSVLAGFGLKQNAVPFIHGQLAEIQTGMALISSYHCSRYNTNTGRLTTPMFEDVFSTITQHLSAS
ncbi:MAG: uracil-DNA glycosylase [Pseudomonadota bacterium]